MNNLLGLKKLLKAEIWFSAFIATLCIIAGLPALAQNSVPEKVDVDITAGTADGGGGGGGWYAQPWVWVLGVAVFIIIIIAITRSGSARKDV